MSFATILFEVFVWGLGVLSLFIFSWFFYAEMSDITHRPEHKSLWNYTLVIVWFLVTVALIIGATLVVRELTVYPWYMAYPGALLGMGVAMWIAKQAFRTVDYMITRVDYQGRAYVDDVCAP